METINYKGFKIEIVQDENYENPKEWGDDNLFLVAFHRDFFVTTDDIKEKDDINEYKKSHWILPLYAYIHSGVSLSLDNASYPYNDRWDSGQVGVVLASKKEFKTIEKAHRAGGGLINTWNDYLSGNVYGYNINELDLSCYGYYGDWDKSGLLDDAKSEIDFVMKKLYENKNKKLKDLIKNKVDLNKRVKILTSIK